MGGDPFKACRHYCQSKDPVISQAQRMAILIEELSRLGIRKYCTAPGSRNTPFILAGIAHPELSFSVFHDERSMAFFALGLARRRVHGVPLVVTTSGTAVANLLPAVIEAKADGVPMIVLSADRPSVECGKGANQTIDQTDIFGVYARTYTIDDTLDAEELLDLISTIAISLERELGPIHINLPLKKPLLEVARLGDLDCGAQILEWRQSTKSWKPKVENNKLGAPALADDFDTILVGANLPRTRTAIQAFLKDFSGDTFFDIQSGSWHCGTRPLSAEVFGDSHSERNAQKRLLIIGHRFTEHRIWDWVSSFQYVEQWKGLKGVFNPNDSISESIDIGWPVKEGLVKIGTNFENTCSIDSPLSYAKIVSLVGKKVVDYESIYLANSLCVRAFDRFRPLGAFSVGAPLYFNRGASGIDGTLATGLGTAMGGKSSLIVCGDHAFLYDLSILADVGKLAIQATVIVVDNAGGRIFEHLPIAENDALDDYFVASSGVDLMKVISAFGLPVFETDSSQVLEEYLNEDFSGLRFIVAKVDPAFDFKAFNRPRPERDSTEEGVS